MKLHFLAPILMKLGRNVARKVSKHLYVPICSLEVPGGHIEFFSIFVQNIKFHFLAPILMKLGRNVARKVSKHLYVPICSLEVPHPAVLQLCYLRWHVRTLPFTDFTKFHRF